MIRINLTKILGEPEPIPLISIPHRKQIIRAHIILTHRVLAGLEHPRGIQPIHKRIGVSKKGLSVELSRVGFFEEAADYLPVSELDSHEEVGLASEGALEHGGGVAACREDQLGFEPFLSDFINKLVLARVLGSHKESLNGIVGVLDAVWALLVDDDLFARDFPFLILRLLLHLHLVLDIMCLYRLKYLHEVDIGGFDLAVEFFREFLFFHG